MYINGYYTNQSINQIKQDIEHDGFHPIKYTDGPSYQYPLHSHAETKILAFLKGSMLVVVEGKKYHCKEGDKLIIDSNKEHSAVVGKDGCTFFWSEKLV